MATSDLVVKRMPAELMARLQSYIGFINEKAVLDDFRSIDEVLRTYDVDAQAAILALTLLRSSFVFRNRLPSWNGLRDRVRETLILNGNNLRPMKGLW